MSKKSLTAGLGPDVAWSTRILERARYVTNAQISQSALRSAVHPVVVVDETVQKMVVRLEADVLREHLLDDETDVPFHARVPVDVPPRPVRRSALGGFLAAAIVAIASVVAGSFLLCLSAILVALLAVWTLVEPMDAMPTIAKVHGQVTVKASYFHAFPENTAPLSDEYGVPRRVVQLQQPSPEFYARV